MSQRKRKRDKGRSGKRKEVEGERNTDKGIRGLGKGGKRKEKEIWIRE